MNGIIAYCGIECSKCPALIAKRENNDELRKKTAEEWSKAFGAEITPEQINCVGCLATEGVQISYCGECEIRKCCIEKKMENCAHCTEYICEKLGKWFKNVPDAKERLDTIKKNL